MSNSHNGKHKEVGLPGLGRPINDFPAEPDSEDGERLRFPHAIAEKCASRGIVVRERRMLDFINKITDKPEWDQKVFDEAIVAKWREEGCVWSAALDDVYLSSAMFDYVGFNFIFYNSKCSLTSVC